MKFKALVTIPLFVASLQAATVDDLTFALINGDTEYSVSDCLETASGSLEIPSVYNGLPVTSIGYAAFYNCTSLTNINIPNSVTSIGEAAFQDSTNIISITIPDSVISIGYAAFYNCTSLSNITIPDSVTSIGGEAFGQCTSITSIAIPDNVTSIEIATFYDCSNLTNLILGNNVNTIGFKAFNGCSSLSSVNIPENLISIHPSAFYKCSSLNEITVSPQNSAYTSLDNSLYNKAVTSLVRSRSDVTEISLPSTVTVIGGDAYGGCLGLISITIPDNITTVGMYAFGYCSNLESVSYSSQTSIEPGVFEYCISLSSFNIPDSVTSISSDAFESCINLSSIIIPDSVTFIGGNAFLNCSNLNYIRCEATTAPTIGSDWWTGSIASPFAGVAVQSISVPPGSAQSYLDAGDGSTYGGLTVLTDLDSDNDGIGDSADEFPNKPTQDVINAIKSNPSRYSLYSTSDIQDLRAGSTMIEVQDGQATLTMEIEQSDDLGIWTNGGASTLQIPIDAEAGKKFFRFRMDDSASFSPDWTPPEGTP